MNVTVRQIEVSVGLWATTTFALSGLLVSHYVASAAALFSCAVISGLYIVFLVCTHRPRTRIKTIPALIAVAGNAFSLGLLAFGFRDVLEPQVARFGFTKTTLLLSSPLDREHAMPWRFLWNGSGVPPAVPIQLMVGIILENEQPNPTTITKYAMSWAQHASGPWRPLCPVDSIGARLYWGYDPAKSIETGADDFADRKLIGVRLMPFDPIHFKTAWDCPDTCSATYLKFSIVEANGRESATIFRQDAAKPTEMAVGIGDGFRMFGPDRSVDISHTTVSFDATCKP